MNEPLIILLSLATAITAAIPGTLAYFNQRKAEARQDEGMASDAWREMIDPLRHELATLREEYTAQKLINNEIEIRVEALEQENKILRAGVDLLLRQLEAHGITPIWKWSKD